MLDFNKMMDDFKSTDNDPRELVLLYKNLLGSDKQSLSKHFNKTEFKFDLETIINQWKMENDRMDLKVEDKIKESKVKVCQILEQMNQ